MSHCEESEEERSDKHHIHRPEPPSVSMKNEDQPPDFSHEPGPPVTMYVSPHTHYNTTGQIR